jgi:hypothetical protein
VVRICPKCGSKVVRRGSLQYVDLITGGPEEFQCEECGYYGNFFPDVDEKEVENFKKKLENDV